VIVAVNSGYSDNENKKKILEDVAKMKDLKGDGEWLQDKSPYRRYTVHKLTDTSSSVPL
jgi:hypothetical protein